MEQVSIGVIGGSGLYKMPEITNVKEYTIETPFGMPSAPLVVGTLRGKRVAFLPRHGAGHVFTPSTVPYRANICALKMIGVRHIIAVNACGSLREDYAPGHVVIPDQLYDMTKHDRGNSFFGTGMVAHISVADPFCSELSQIAHDAVQHVGGTAHLGGNFVTIEGPRFSTRGESKIYRTLGFDSIGNPAYSYNAETLTPTVFCRIKHDDIVWLLAEAPQVALNILLAVNEQLTQAREFLGDVAVAKTVQAMLATQDGAEESLVVRFEHVQGPTPATFQRRGFADLVEQLDQAVIEGDMGQAIEIPMIRFTSDLMVAIEIGHALVHGTPGHRLAALPRTRAADLELAGLVDDRLDTQHQAEFVVHLQPVVLDPVLDPGTGHALLLARGKYLAIETGMQPTTEESENVVGGEVEQGMVEQFGIKLAQGGTILEEQIGRELGLVDDPVVVALAEPTFAEQRVEALGPAVEDVEPAQPRELVGQALGAGSIVDLGEGVVVLDEADAFREELPGQPLVAVDVDLDREGEPRLQADVDEAELRVEEVEVEDALRPPREHQARPVLAADQLDGAAAFLDAENGDDPSSMERSRRMFSTRPHFAQLPGVGCSGTANLAILSAGTREDAEP